jgi:DNA-binding MarR family transcriptional regulator
MTAAANQEIQTGGGGTFDFGNKVDRDHARRIGVAWIELRRGALTSNLRDYMLGKDNRLEQGQMDALDLLIRRECSMRGLADRLRVEPSTATRAVNRLVDDGFAERFTKPDDGRVVMVRITDEGRVCHTDVARRRSYAMAQILSEFEPDERAQLADLLDRFINALDHVVQRLD